MLCVTGRFGCAPVECLGRDTVAELVTVLSRPKFDRDAPPRQRDDFVAGFRARTVVVEVTTTVSDCADPKDNMAHLLESL